MVVNGEGQWFSTGGPVRGLICDKFVNISSIHFVWLFVFTAHVIVQRNVFDKYLTIEREP
jgi:hypothetical protein